MAFNRDALHVVAATAGGFTLWHYRTDDRHLDLEKPDYWRDAGTLRPGDRIFVDCYRSGSETAREVHGTMCVDRNGQLGWLDVLVTWEDVE